MVKIINPVPTAKLYLKYSGRRVNFIYQDPTFQTVYLKYDKSNPFIEETVTAKVRLTDGTDIYIGFLSRKIYKLNNNNQWQQDNESFLMLHEVIVDKSIVFITGLIVNVVNLYGEFIEDNYKFRLFATKDCERMFSHIDNENENLEIDDFR